ncbi:hypothetical protein LCGC14_2490920, partial [marine sediment metagenome]
MTPEQTNVITKVKGILKVAFPAMQGSLTFHLAKKKPNADRELHPLCHRNESTIQ